MSTTEVVNLTINATEVYSLNDTVTKMVSKTAEFSNRYGLGDQFDARTVEEDLLFFLVKRKQLGLKRLAIHVLEDGEIAVGSFSGRRKATLIFNLNYIGGKGYI